MNIANDMRLRLKHHGWKRALGSVSEAVLPREQPRLQHQQHLQPRLLQDRQAKRLPLFPQRHLRPHPRQFYRDPRRLKHVPGYVDPVPGNNEACVDLPPTPPPPPPPPPPSEPAPPPRAEKCNATVKAGGDAPETIDIDLGGYQGTAKFSWENFTIKDRMKLSGGGQLIHDTQCVGGSGTMDFPAGGLASVRVEVEPNCDGNTSGTAWEFKVECPPIQLEFAPKPPTMVTPPVLCPHGQVKQGDTCVDVTPPAAEPAPEPAPKKVPPKKKKPPVIKRQPGCPPGYYYNRRARRCVPVRVAPQPLPPCPYGTIRIGRLCVRIQIPHSGGGGGGGGGHHD